MDDEIYNHVNIDWNNIVNGPKKKKLRSDAMDGGERGILYTTTITIECHKRKKKGMLYFC